MMAFSMDVSMGHLLNHVDGPGTTIEMKAQYLAPIKSGLVRCEASFLRRGRSISFIQSAAFGSDNEPIAHATATWKRLPISRQ